MMTDLFAVFEGGGVKGIAHVGALARFHQEKSLQFKGYAGTSAGAIVAALAAVGYHARKPSSPLNFLAPLDLNMVMDQLDFVKLLGPAPVPFDELRRAADSFRETITRLVDAGQEFQRLVTASMWTQLCNARPLLRKYQADLQALLALPQLFQGFSVKKGMYDTETLLTSLQQCLRYPGLVKSGKLTFHNLYNANNTILKLVATDLRDPEPRVFGPIHSPNVEIASAVQASISIPLFFCPFVEGSTMLVDGGLRSNYPLWIFEEERKKNDVLLPIIGFRLQESPVSESLSLPENYIWGLINGALEGAGWRQGTGIKRVVEVFTTIPAHIRATSFDVTDRDKEILLLHGYMAADDVLIQPDNRELLGLLPLT